MNSKLSIQNENKTYDRIDTDLSKHFKNDLTKIIALKLPDADIFRHNYLNSNKIEFRLTEVLFKLNELTEKISELDQTRKVTTQLFDLVQVLDGEIQRAANVNGTWSELEKYFQKVCFIKINQDSEETQKNLNENQSNADLDLLENLKCEKKSLETKLFKAEKDICFLRAELEKQMHKNERTEIELDQQLTRTIEISLEFKKKTTEIEKKLKDLNEEYKRFQKNCENNHSN